MDDCPFLVLCRDREFWFSVATGSPCRDRVPRPRTRHDLGVRSVRARVEGRSRVRNREGTVLRHACLCHDMAIYVVTQPPGRPDGLGRERVFLCRYSAQLALCHDIV